MATDTPQLLLLTSTRNHCRTHRCNQTNERPLVSPCPDTRNDPQRICHCSDTRLELRMFRSTCISLSGPCCRRPSFSMLKPSLHCHSAFARNTTSLERSSLRSAHTRTERSHNTYSAHREITQHLLRYHVVIVLRFLGLIEVVLRCW